MSWATMDPIFRNMPTADLAPELECRQWDRLEAVFSGEDTSFIDLQLADLQRELARRERLRALPGAPQWPAEPTPEIRAYWAELKDRVTVLDLWHRHFPMQPPRKSGRNWRARCPLHAGDNPNSFGIYNGARNYHCFVCGASGDVFTLAGILYRTTRFAEIVDRLAAEFGIEKPVPLESKIELVTVPTGRRSEPKPRYPEFIGGRVVVS